MTPRTPTMIVLTVLLLAAAPAFAEDAHHPPGAAAQATPGAAMPMGGGGGMMMGGGMMGGGMMGMGCPMMGGQGGRMGMMGMMGGAGMADMARHIDGHVAFLKAELKITPAQEKEWTAFADALRASVATLAQMPGMATQGTGTDPSIDQTFAQKERQLTTRLDHVKALRAAWSTLDPVLTPEQRTSARQLVAPHLSMM